MTGREAAAVQYLEAHEATLSRLWATWLTEARAGRALTALQINCIYAGAGNALCPADYKPPTTQET